MNTMLRSLLQRVPVAGRCFSTTRPWATAAAEAAAAAAPQQAITRKATLFLGSLPWKTQPEELRHLLDSAAGRPVVTGVRIAKNKETGRPRGFAHVDIAAEQGEEDLPAHLIATLNGAPFAGRLIKVDLAPDALQPASSPAPRPPKPEFQVARTEATYTLFVAGMPWKTTEAEIRDLVEDVVGHATVSDVRFVVDRATGRIKGYGYVDVECEEDALKAIQALDGFMLDGRRLLVNSDMKNKEARSSSMAAAPAQ